MYSCENCSIEFKYKGSNYSNKYCCLSCQVEHKVFLNKKERLEKFNNGTLLKRQRIYEILVDRDGNKCSICSITEWNKQPIRFWVDHIDGDPTNNKPDNFRLICPNCESQTPTSRGKNKGNGRTSKGLKPYS